MNRKNSTSVVLAVYNGEKYLKEQLDSLLNQTLKPDELIIVNDASTDNSLEIINGYKDQFKNVIVKNHPTNLGITKSFEDGIKLATSDYIFLSDQDDYWLKDKIADYLIEFEKNKEAILIFSNAEITDDKLNSTGSRMFDYLNILDLKEVKFNQLIKANKVQGASTAFKSTLKESILPLPSNWIHDHWIATIASIKGPIIKIDKVYMLYRQHGSNAIGITKKTTKKVKSKSSLKKIKYTYNDILPLRKEKFLKISHLHERVNLKDNAWEEKIINKSLKELSILSSLDEGTKIKLISNLICFLFTRKRSYIPLSKKDYVRDIIYVLIR